MLRISTDKKIGYAVATIVSAAILPIFLVPAEYIRLAACIYYVLAALLILTIIKKRSIHSYNSRQILLITTVFAALYLMLYFLSGIAYGFFSSPRGTVSLGSLLKTVIPIAVIIVAVELMRPVLVGQHSRIMSLLAGLIGISSELLCYGGVLGVDSSIGLSNLVALAFFPAVTANILFNYLAKSYGAAPSVAYRLILTLYTYLIPVITGMPEPMMALILLLMPLGIHAFVRALYERERKVAAVKKSKLRFIPTVLLVTLMTAFVMLITCKFRYGLLVIATGSMSGEIEKGDAVVYEDYEDYQNHDRIREGDVIVFEEYDRRVVHRVNDIINENGVYQYITKGDANEGNDVGYRTDADITGVVKFKIAYIGYPTIWLRDIFTK